MIEVLARQARLRAGERRSVLLWRRDDADAPLFALRDGLRPAPSAFALAAARLGWSEQDCAMLSLHGRPLEAIVPHLQPDARILALSWDGDDAGQARGAYRGARHGAVEAHGLRGHGRPARAHPDSAGGKLRP